MVDDSQLAGTVVRVHLYWTEKDGAPAFYCTDLTNSIIDQDTLLPTSDILTDADYSQGLLPRGTPVFIGYNYHLRPLLTHCLLSRGKVVDSHILAWEEFKELHEQYRASVEQYLTAQIQGPSGSYLVIALCDNLLQMFEKETALVREEKRRQLAQLESLKQKKPSLDRFVAEHFGLAGYHGQRGSE